MMILVKAIKLYVLIIIKGLEPSLRKQLKADGQEDLNEETKESKATYVNPFPQDADDEDFQKSSVGSKSKKSEESDDDESDDEKLFEEYERIKREREEEQKKKVNFIKFLG